MTYVTTVEYALREAQKSADRRYVDGYHMMGELCLHAQLDEGPCLEFEEFPGTVRGFFSVRLSVLSVVTINTAQFDGGKVFHVARTMAHELVHFQMKRLGYPDYGMSHDESFRAIAERMFDHKPGDTYGGRWLELEAEFEQRYTTPL